MDRLYARFQNTAVYIVMNGLDGTELPAFSAGNPLPFIAMRQFIIRCMAFRQKLPVFFMDVPGLTTRFSDASAISLGYR